MRNVLTDLKIKVDILEKEKQRCQNRSKFQVLQTTKEISI